MNDFWYAMYDWIGFMIFTLVSLFRIIRWLVPNRKWGHFLKYVPYRKSQRYLALFTAAIFIGYLVLSALDATHTVSAKAIRCALVTTWVVTLLLPDKQYEFGTLTAFGFKSSAQSDDH